MTSIRRRLLISILAVLSLATLATGIATYLGIRHEMDELYDANMRQLALMASSMITDKEIPQSAPAFSSEWPRGEQIFLIQIWKNGAILYTSHPVANFPLQEKTGFGRVFFDEKKWSYYQQGIDGKVIQIAQELGERRDVIREVYNAIIIPELIQFPLLFIVIWLLVGYGLRPLGRMSDLIQKRDAGYMQPIPIGKAPQEIHSLVGALNDLLGRLERSMETQKRFTADAAHELRTPLTAVRLQLDLLQRSQIEQDRKDAIDSLERGVSRSIHLVQQLLELARQEPGKNDPLQPVNLGNVVKAIHREQKSLADAKNINVHLDTKDSFVIGNHNDLVTMIGNLLSNAIAYTHHGGDIVLRTDTQDSQPLLEVSDNGIGIANTDKSRIFDRFYRVIGTNTAGSGLGLSIVKAIADKHGAKITVLEGLNNKGTTFRLLFPAP